MGVFRSASLDSDVIFSSMLNGQMVNCRGLSMNRTASVMSPSHRQWRKAYLLSCLVPTSIRSYTCGAQESVLALSRWVHEWK